ncbi:hypothetical protein RKD21_000125 [Streptomyces albogriseolus]|uniref:Uncharacterized protein n=1 Tax=Streptomyces albogriseolus TaxID=1887 RepID=A0ACC6UEH2_STRAO
MALPSDAAGRMGQLASSTGALVLTSSRKMSRADRSCTETVAQHIRAKGIPPPGRSVGCWGHRHGRSEHWHS